MFEEDPSEGIAQSGGPKLGLGCVPQGWVKLGLEGGMYHVLLKLAS